MSMKEHKRKRSIQDTPVNLSKMKLAMNHFVSLKEELGGVQETEREVEAIMEHLQALQKILGSAKKTRIEFSSLAKKDIENLGIARKRLVFHPEGVDELLSKSNTPSIEDEFTSLNTRLNEIYDHVNMDFEPGARMILDAILLSVAKISAKHHANHAVAILPEMRLATEDGILITHPMAKHEAWLTGSVDYGVIEYRVGYDNKMRLLGEDASREDALALAAGRLFLVQAKRLLAVTTGLSQHMPEAVGQAVVLSELAKHENL